MDIDYDEDLSENQFLRELRKEYECVLQRVIQEGWIICVPRSGSFTNRKFQEDEINGHILIPKQNLSVAQFNTLNGKEVLVMDRILNVNNVNGVAKQYSSRLLFEETFYDKDLYRYNVWCIEQPLEDSMYILKSNTNVITNLQEAVNFLQIELLERQLCNNLEIRIKEFLHMHKDLDCETLQVQSELVHKLYTDCLKILLENATLREKSSSNKQYNWNVRVSLETYILYALRDVLLKSLSACTAVEDSDLNKIVRNLDEIQLNDLQIRSDLHSRIHNGKLELSRLDRFVTVLGKIECLKRTVNHISHGASSVSSDDLLPVLIFLIIKARLSNWIAQLTFMKQFRFSTRSINEADRAGFLITSLEAAIEHIRSGALKNCGNSEKSSKELISARSCSITGQSEYISVNYLFTCIKKGNLPEVERILTHNKSNPINDITLCHPLCRCTSCERNWTKYRNLNMYPKDDKGLTPLHVAVSYNQITIVDFLLDHDTDVNIVDSDGLTALHYACNKGYQNILLQLLHANADPMITDAGRNTSLHLISDHGHENCLKTLLYLSEQIKVPIDINAQNNSGDTALHLASKWGYERIVRILLECGANCRIINKKGQTPLTVTNSKYITELLECNVASDISSSTVSQHTSQSHQLSLQQQSFKNDSLLLSNYYVKTMQQHIIDRIFAAIIEGDVCLACYYLGLEVYREKTNTRTDLCHPLCNCERCSVIEESLEQKRRQRILTVNTCNNVGETALHVASATGCTEIVQLLLDAGANVNVITNPEGRTPLHLACLNDSVNVVKLLLNCATCNIDSRDHNGDTPLHLMTRAGNMKLVGLLVRYGANTNIRNLQNMTPLRQMEKEMSTDENISSVDYTNILKFLKENSVQAISD